MEKKISGFSILGLDFKDLSTLDRKNNNFHQITAEKHLHLLFLHKKGLGKVSIIQFPQVFFTKAEPRKKTGAERRFCQQKLKRWYWYHPRTSITSPVLVLTNI